MASIVGGPSGALVPGHARNGLESGRILATTWTRGKAALLGQLPGHSPVHLSNKRAPRRSITVLTTEKIAPWMAAASKISLNGYSVSSGFGGSGLSPGAAHFQTYLKMVPAMSPRRGGPASPMGR